MTVNELKSILKDLDDDACVLLCDSGDYFMASA